MFLGLTPPGASYLDIFYYTFTRGAAGLALVIVTAVTVPLLTLIPLQLHRISHAPKDIPWVGPKSNTRWSKLKSTLLALKYERGNMEEGWEKVCRPALQPITCIIWSGDDDDLHSTAAKANLLSDLRSIGLPLSCRLITPSGLLSSPRISLLRPKSKTSSWRLSGLLPDRVMLSFMISRSFEEI